MPVLSSGIKDEEKEVNNLSCNSCNSVEKIKVQQYAVLPRKKWMGWGSIRK